LSRKGLVAALVNPLSLAVTAVGGTTFGLSGLWWILPLTAAAAGAVAAVQYRSQVEEESDLAPLYRERERALLGLVDRIAKVLDESTSTIKSCLTGMPQQLQQMRTTVRDLLRRQSRIDAFLAELPAQRAARELEQLEGALAAARTEDARAKFSNAVANKRSEMSSREDLRATSERIAAELAEIESVLENTLSRIVSLEHAHGPGLEEGGAGITHTLDEVLLTVRTLEQTLSEIQDPGGRYSRS